MVLNEVARQTGVYVRTLRYRAKKLFGRTKGEFTDEEVDLLLKSIKVSWNRVKEQICSEETGKNFPSETGKKFPSADESIKLDPQLIVSIDRLLQFKIPHWKDYDKHLKVLSKLLHEVAKKGAEQYERDLIEAQQLAEEYNQWLDEQIEEDYLDGFKSRAQQDVDNLNDEGAW